MLPREGLQDAVLDVVEIEELLSHQLEIGAGRPGVWLGVEPRLLHARDVHEPEERLGATRAVGLDVLAPLFGHELVKLGPGLGIRVDIAIDEVQPRLRAGGGHGTLPDNFVHSRSPKRG